MNRLQLTVLQSLHCFVSSYVVMVVLLLLDWVTRNNLCLHWIEITRYNGCKLSINNNIDMYNY